MRDCTNTCCGDGSIICMVDAEVATFRDDGTANERCYRLRLCTELIEIASYRQAANCIRAVPLCNQCQLVCIGSNYRSQRK